MLPPHLSGAPYLVSTFPVPVASKAYQLIFFLNLVPAVAARGFDEDLEARLVEPTSTLTKAQYRVVRRNVALSVLEALYERDMQDDLATRDLAYQVDELD